MLTALSLKKEQYKIPVLLFLKAYKKITPHTEVADRRILRVVILNSELVSAFQDLNPSYFCITAKSRQNYPYFN